MKTRFIIFGTTVVIALGIYFLISAILPDHNIPEEFSAARLKGAELAKNIVDLSGESLKNLEEISRFDQEGDAPEALILASKEVIKNRETHEQAIRLASQLEKMARALSAIKPTSARIFATEAVSSEVALVSRLISYNDFLRQLFETLKDKFQGQARNPDGKVQSLILKINDEARAINDFNKRFNQSLTEFDKIFLP